MNIVCSSQPQFRRIFTKSDVTKRDLTKSDSLLPAVTVTAGHEPSRRSEFCRVVKKSVSLRPRRQLCIPLMVTPPKQRQLQIANPSVYSKPT